RAGDPGRDREEPPHRGAHRTRPETERERPEPMNAGPADTHLDLGDLIAEVTGQAIDDRAREPLALCGPCRAEAKRWDLVAGAGGGGAAGGGRHRPPGGGGWGPPGRVPWGAPASRAPASWVPGGAPCWPPAWRPRSSSSPPSATGRPGSSTSGSAHPETAPRRSSPRSTGALGSSRPRGGSSR